MKVIQDDDSEGGMQLWLWARHGKRAQWLMDLGSPAPAFCSMNILSELTPGILADVGHYNDDEYPDFMATRTCAGCTSNHVIMIGTPPSK